MISINPSPEDRRCQCCYRPTEELTPFPKAPNGQTLFKTFRNFSGCIGASWECYDCIGLSDKEYYKRRDEDEFTKIVRKKVEDIKNGYK